MVSEAVLVAIIAALGSVFGQWLISRKQDQDRAVKEAERDARFEERLKGVEKRLDTHNNYAEKLGQMQVDLASLATEIKNLKESA
ncbi:MAG: hypothetical protein IIW14_08585 [Kiritimatiellae bacterium]|jgi:hypothetical protein|nr:hypothetical protein [Kiritimatiellia bacterium]